MQYFPLFNILIVPVPSATIQSQAQEKKNFRSIERYARQKNHQQVRLYATKEAEMKP